MTLGYIYYELSFYQEAIKHFADIPSDDPVYPEALLARSWCAIKLEDYQEAIIALNQLIDRSRDDKYGEEAHFLLGQCYMELGFQDFAIREFDYIVSRYPATNNIETRIEQVQQGLIEQRQQTEKLQVQLLLLESKLLDMIPLADHQMPKYLKDEKQRLDETRDSLIKKILAEKKVFQDFQWGIEKLKEDIVLKQSRRHWRAYAEYGKARAYFLKTIPRK